MEVLTAEELRVLGALIEKEATTPDQYPLTMNGLLSATNQTSNRNPVVSYDARHRRPGCSAVSGSWAWPGWSTARATGPRSTATWCTRRGPSAPRELAVLAVLALRGPQTVNELRTRTERYGDLGDIGGVDGVLHRLKNRYEEPYVIRLERQPGQREERWAHLLAGEVLDVPAEASAPRGSGSAERVSVLEAQVAQLADQVSVMRADLDRLLALLD